MKNKTKAVATYGDLMKAEMAKSQLAAFGIDAQIAADDCGGMRPDLRLNRGIHLFVDPDLSDRAEEILSTSEGEIVQQDELIESTDEEDQIWREKLARGKKKGRIIGRVLALSFSAAFLALSRLPFTTADAVLGKTVFIGAALFMLVVLGLSFLGSTKGRG